MNRQQKEAVVADFKEKFAASQASFLVRYKGLSVKDISSLRKTLRESGSELKITKARLMKIAAGDLDGADSFRESFCDQVGLVFAYDEVPPVAKRLIEFSEEHKALDVLSCFFEARMLSRAEVEFFASLPSKDVLFAQLAASLQAPASNFARALSAPMQQLACALKQLSQGKGAE